MSTLYYFVGEINKSVCVILFFQLVSEEWMKEMKSFEVAKKNEIYIIRS